MDDLKQALGVRISYFAENGCQASDHGLDYIFFRPADDAAVENIFQSGLSGGAVSAAEAESFKTALMLFFGKQFARLGWIMQLHYGAQRNNNTAAFEKLGPDTGYDSISARECSGAVTGFLNALKAQGALPKTILYSLNPHDDAMLITAMGCFQGAGTPGKIQHGSAWWFNDTKTGMEQQMLNLASAGILGVFVGMLTDSRSFLSYARHEYFRRVLCNLLGGLVENGEYPADMDALGEMVKDISFRNTARYFGYNMNV
ncbi:MAG: glucuronate isomerase [Oscillospiraceae bacterium]|nr:glucuronate isomerase [Oscillospiraceae bacterium]